MEKRERFLFIDNLRLLMIILVVMVHLAVTYSGIGGWYYKEGRPIGTISALLFGYFQSFTQGYFMGFLFLIAGYFIPGSYDKKGFGKFIKDRFIRLGIPTLIYMLIISPFINAALLHNVDAGGQNLLIVYLYYIISFKFIGESGPLWFAFALLIFSIIYALARNLTNKNKKYETKMMPEISKIIKLILLISVCAFLIRLVQPMDTSILNMQLCFFSQYIILFIVGILCYRYRWFSGFDYKYGKRWLFAALVPGFVVWVIIILSGGALNGNFNLYKGGLYWQSSAYALWESFISVSMAIGLITLFREKFNKQNQLIKVMSDSAFTVYMFHAPIIIFFTLLFKSSTLLPIIKFVLLSVIGIPICFLCAHFIIRRIPILKKVI
jgi:glucans biosynthesis protein C